MRTTISTLTLLTLLSLGMAISHAQTRGPSQMYDELDAGGQAEIDALYTDRAPFVLGWNWGGALLGVNQDLQMNMWHIDYPFRWGATTNLRPQHKATNMVSGAHMAMAPAWNIPAAMWHPTAQNATMTWYQAAAILDGVNNLLDFDLGHCNGPSLIEANGMRFHPELDMSDTTTFTVHPGDTQRAVWGFRTKDTTIGTVPTTGENTSRYVLDATGVTNWTTVLDQSWPDQQFCEWKNNNNLEQLRSFKGHLMYLNVHLRRTDASDTQMDDEEILRLRVHYRVAADTNAYTVRFDSLPATTGTPTWIALPNTLDGAARGVRWPLQERTGGSVQEMVITREMIPPGNSANRDVTVQAHFKAMPLDAHGTITQESNAYLRDRWLLGKPINLSSDKDGGRIIRMWIEVEYRGQSDIAIDWVEIGTENYTWFTQGYHDELALQGYEEMADALTTHNAERAQNNLDPIRIWQWYNRDEGAPAYWNGMGYMHDLFDSLATTELHMLKRDPSYLDRYLHTTGTNVVWEGEVPRFNNKGISPYYLKGARGDTTLCKHFLNNKWGRHDLLYTTQDTIDYDVFYDDPDNNRNQLTLPAPVQSSLVSGQPYPFGPKEGESAQAMFEAMRYELAEKGDYLFRDNIMWMPNFWLSADYKWIADNRDGTLDMFVAVPEGVDRHLTGEEFSLLAWSSVILGAKGLVYYWGSNVDSLTQKIAFHGRDYVAYGLAYGPADSLLIRYDETPVNGSYPRISDVFRDGQGRISSGVAAAARTTTLASHAARSAFSGEDWLTGDNSTGLFQVLSDNSLQNTIVLEDVLDTLYGDQQTGSFYLGWLSQRSAAQSVHEVADRAADDLQDLHLRAWYHQRYRTWNTGDTALWSATVRVNDIRTRHPHRDPVNRPMTWEDTDSTVAEITLLQDDGIQLTDTFYVGVLNRRVSPMYYDPNWSPLDSNHVDLSTFHTYEGHRQAIVNATDKSIRYAQAGARTVEIPFSFRHPDGKPRNLKVVRLGVETDATHGIAALDTIIGQDARLRIDLMPGEGTMLKVTPIAASTESTQLGYLDHSNQRKLVAYPEVTGWEIVYDTVDSRSYYRQLNGDTTWYHRVYHRRRDDDTVGLPDNTSVLSVFYQRRQPILNADNATAPSIWVQDASTIEWEDEILVSDTVVFQQTGVPEDTLELSCGYPSIVVRIDTLDPAHISKVYVVYACEYEAATETMPAQLLITEAVLPAEGTRQRQIDYLQANLPTGLATSIAKDVPYLKHWGTPMINASASGNYYCWSDAANGIGVGYKAPNARTFATNQLTYVASSLGTDTCQSHPSLNSYSRLHLGEETAGLVWQAGNHPLNGSRIMYTQLKHNAMGGIYYELSADNSPATVYAKTNTVWSQPFAAPMNTMATLVDDVFLLGETTAYYGSHRFPVIYRHLSDWDMDPTSRVGTLRQLNLKAERVFWETGSPIDTLAPPYIQNNPRQMIGRRVFDVQEWSVANGGQDTIAVLHYNFIFSDTMLLNGPDIVQGEQTGEPLGIPADTTYWHEDSTLVLNFWSRPTSLQSPPTIWQLTHGYATFYGTDDDHVHSDLVNQGLLEPIQERGNYSHLAARYSMYAHEGWQRNRRFFNMPEGDWTGNWTNAPRFITSSQYFFKDGTDGNTPHGFVYRGVRGQAGDALLGPVWVESQKQWVSASTFHAPQGGKDGSVATPWMRLTTVDDIAVMTRAWSDDDIVGTLFIERRSDGQRLNMNAVFRNQDGKVKRMAHTLLSDPQEQYRLILIPAGENLYPAQDVEITFESNMSFAKGDSRNIIDLRTMGEGVNATDELMVYPNPAHEDLTIVVNLEEESKRISPWKASEENATIRMFSLNGASINEQSCMLTDVLHVDLSTVPSGIYTVQVTTSAGTVLTRQVSVVH